MVSVNPKGLSIKAGRVTLVGLCCLFMVAANVVWAGTMYRYVDDSGRKVYSAVLPSEYAEKGYSVLNEQGQVIKEVPAAPTAAELAVKQAAAVAAEAVAAARKVKDEADKLLVRLYRTPEDIDRKRDNSIKQLNARISLAEASIVTAEAECTRLEGIIETGKNEGREPSQDAVKKIAASKEEITQFQAHIVQAEEEKAALAANALRDTARLRELLNLPNTTEASNAAIASESSAEQATSQ